MEPADMTSSWIYIKLSAANHSNNVVSALLAFRKSGFGMIVLIIVVIATVYTMQIISQSNRLDFLPPDVPLADCGAAHCAACGFDLQAREGGRMDWGMCGGKAEIHSLPGDCFWSLVQVPCCRRPLSSCWDAVWDAAQILRQRNTQRHTNPPCLLPLCFTHRHLCIQKHRGKFKLFLPLTLSLSFSLYLSLLVGEFACAAAYWQDY